MKISVVGCGYLGAVHAASMVQLGHDGRRDRRRRTKGRRAACRPGHPSTSPASRICSAAALATGRLRFSTDIADAAGAQVHFVCVGTPQKRGEYAADLHYVEAAAESLLEVLNPGDLVVGKSTVPVGTAARLAEMVEEKVPGALLAWNPEFLREGFAVQDTLHPDRLVYGLPAGGDGEIAERMLDEVYAAIVERGTPKVVTDYATAEMVKTAANSLPGHQDLLHQRDGRAVRGDRRRREAAGRRHRLRRPDRPQVPQRRARLRRRLPAQGHPRVHGPRR